MGYKKKKKKTAYQKPQFPQLCKKESRKLCRYGKKCPNKVVCFFRHENLKDKRISRDLSSKNNNFEKDIKLGNCVKDHRQIEKLPTKKEKALRAQRIAKKFKRGDQNTICQNNNTIEETLSEKIVTELMLTKDERCEESVMNIYENFSDYFKSTVENYLSEYEEFFLEKLQEKKTINLLVQYSNEDNVFAWLTNEEDDFYSMKKILLIVGDTRFMLKYDENLKHFRVATSRYSDFHIFATLNPLMKCKRNSKHSLEARMIGGVDHFYTNLSAMYYVFEEKSEFNRIVNFLVDPTEVFTGDYGKKVIAANAVCNEVQLLACNQLKNAFEIIQSPPGTKANDIIATIVQKKLPTQKILIISTKIDKLSSVARSISKTNKSLIILESSSKLSASLKAFSFEYKVTADKEFQDLTNRIQSLKDQLVYCSKKFNKNVSMVDFSAETRKITGEIRTATDRLEFLKWFLKEKVLSDSDTYLTTVSEIGKIEIPKIHTVVLKNAEEINESAIFSVLKQRPRNVVLVGDYKQSPPFVLTDAGTIEERKNLDTKMRKSLMERMVDAGCSFSVLTIQYQMHEDIMHLFSSLFYEGTLEMGRNAQEMPGGLFWSDVCFAETWEKNGIVFNSMEVDRCCKIYSRERNFMPEKTITIITFYPDQSAKLKNRLSRYKDANLRVVSLEGLKGNPADCVIFSCVRSNLEGNLGLLSNRQFLKDAISMAKNSLYFVGDWRFYSGCLSEEWKQVVSYCTLRHD